MRLPCTVSHRQQDTTIPAYRATGAFHLFIMLTQMVRAGRLWSSCTSGMQMVSSWPASTSRGRKQSWQTWCRLRILGSALLLDFTLMSIAVCWGPCLPGLFRLTPPPPQHCNADMPLHLPLHLSLPLPLPFLCLCLCLCLWPWLCLCLLTPDWLFKSECTV